MLLSQSSLSSSCVVAPCLYHDEDSNSWNSYVNFMAQVAREDRVIRKCSKIEVEAVQQFLLQDDLAMDKEDILNAQNYNSSSSSIQFRIDSQNRRKIFLNLWKFSEKQKDYLDRCFTYLGDRCASAATSNSSNSIDILTVAWTLWRSTGCSPRENSISTYMYVLATGGEAATEQSQENQLPKIKRYDPKLCLWDLLAVHDSLFAPNEKTITLRIQSWIAQNKPLQAERLLQQSTEAGRLRTFAPLLTYYCRRGDMESALRCFQWMRSAPHVHMDAATYALLLESIAQNRAMTLVNQVLEWMATDLLEINEAAAQAIYWAFRNLADDPTANNPATAPQPIPCFSTWDITKENDLDSDGQHERHGMVMGRVNIDPTTGICSATGTKLRLFSLDHDHRQHVHDTLLDMSFSLQEEYRKTTSSDKNAGTLFSTPDSPINSGIGVTGRYCREQLQQFSTFLTERVEIHGERPFTAFVDGANVAHFGSGYVRYSQIQRMVEELERLGENPLVILPRKYTAERFFLRHLGVIQELAESDEMIKRQLLRRGQIYVVPATCFDDYYWMIASVASQNKINVPSTTLSNVTATNAHNDHPADTASEMEKRGVFLVTNDQMRDHRLALQLQPRLFRRWTSCHIVPYSFHSSDDNPGNSRNNWNQVQLIPPKVFSREIQSNYFGSSEQHRVWHIPVTEWDDSSLFCFSIVSHKQ